MSPLPADLGGGATLRRLATDDAGAVFDAVDAERARLGPWFPWVGGTRSVSDEAAWIASARANPESLDGLGAFVGDELAGGLGLTWEPFRVTGEIGYWLRGAYEGRGIVTASCRVLLDEAFDRLGLHRVCIRAGVANVRSRAVAERLGFVEEGVLRGEGSGTGGYYDLVVYGMLEDEWRARRAAGDAPAD
ncbi:MAG: GNAT family N-acetyltransferase [Actinomycetota bacterium]